MSQPQSGGQSGGAPKKITLSQLSRQTADKGLAIIEKHDTDLAQRLARMRATRPDKPTVVVVGEAKRGKSSLTNALLNVPGLSPVDARVATSTYIMFRRGPHTAARALLPGNDVPVDVPLDRMRDWATDLGNRGQYSPPRLIEVECDSPLLGKLNIVDTPGVGGLDAAHAEIALRAIGRATALLFVCDASAPFTKPELDFLLRASETVDLVIFAVTKTDAYRGWRQVVEDNRALLREHAPRFADAPMMPVSAKLFEQAGLMGASELGVALRKESKIIDLQIALQQQVAIKASALHEANLLRTMHTQLDVLAINLEDSRRACQPDLAYAKQLKDNRDRLLAARKADSRTWQLRLRAQLSRARLDTMADISSEQRKFQQYWRKVVEDSDKSKLSQIAPALDIALKNASMQIYDRQQSRMQNVSRSVLQSMFARHELAEVYAALQRPRAITTTSGPNKKGMTADEKVMTGFSLMSALSLGKLVTLPLEGAVAGAFGVAAGTAGLLMLPVIAAVGVGAASWMVWARRTAADRNNLKVWLNETLGETRGKLEAEASAYFIEAEQELTLALDRALLRRIETLDGHIKQIDNSLKVDRGERERRAAEITKQIHAVKDVCRTIDILLPRLRNAVVAKKKTPQAVPASAPPGAAPSAPSAVSAPSAPPAESAPPAPSAVSAPPAPAATPRDSSAAPPIAAGPPTAAAPLNPSSAPPAAAPNAVAEATHPAATPDWLTSPSPPSAHVAPQPVSTQFGQPPAPTDAGPRDAGPTEPAPHPAAAPAPRVTSAPPPTTPAPATSISADSSPSERTQPTESASGERPVPPGGPSQPERAKPAPERVSAIAAIAASRLAKRRAAENGDD
ncbi:dynamin family protein [Antricoccus suffuscus]|uniref:Dynamin family protein n=1 Tax=Antricoccus suffuscus TaxID=1629062 RepID=A0A2T0ZZY0_9ACTN|nr:dynamin family protein [Antricoccus suffuscus]PRZ41648.1 dynamin family protein [Antricoccus suffuscus]